MSKQHIFNLKFSLKSLQANCHRPSCRVHAFLKIQSEERKFREVADMKKNIAVFNSDLEWDLVGIDYNDITNSYMTKNAIVTIMYETSDTGNRTNKLKVGHVTIDLGTILNDKTYRIHNVYSLEKCYDQAAKIKMAIDLSKIQEAAIRGGGQSLAPDQYTRLKQTMQWRTSKIKERIIDQQKNLLQNKLYQYEDKMQKYRDSHNEQLKRLTDQLERKQQKISILSQQNTSFVNALQSLQMTCQKQKSIISSLEQEMYKLKETNRLNLTNKDSINNQLVNSQAQMNQLKHKLQQVQKAKQKKQQYYKSELDKYNKKYLETQNARNRIVFQMQSKLKEQLELKDQHYKKIIQKLESKLAANNSHSKQTHSKTTKQLIIMKETIQKSEKQKLQYTLELQKLMATKQMLNNIKQDQQKKIGHLQEKIRNLTSQNEVSQFSSNNLLKENNKLKSELKILNKNADDLRYEIQLANRTIQQNQQNIVKLHRQLKVHKERQYYMQQKFQDELEIKTYNEQCIRGTNNHYRNEIKKLTLKIRLYQQKLDEADEALSNLTHQKERLQDQFKRHSQTLFQSSQKNIRFESQIKKLKTSLQESSAHCHSLQLQLLDVQKSYEALELRHETLQNDYQNQIASNSQRIYSLEERMREQKEQYDFALTSDLQAKNTLLEAVQIQLKKVKDHKKSLESQLREKQIKLEQSQANYRSSIEKNRNTQRQINKIKSELDKSKQIQERQIKQMQKLKKEVNQGKQELSMKSIQCDSLQNKIHKVRQAYTELIKWILDRIGNVTVINYISNYSSSITSSRQYIQSIEGEVDIEMVNYVNNGLQRIYNQWEKANKRLIQCTEERDKLNEDLAKIKLEMDYSINKGYEAGIDDNKFEKQLEAITMKINGQPAYMQYNSSLPDHDAQLKDSLKIQQLKRQSKQLQNQINQKNYDIQLTKQQLENERRNIHSLKQQIKDLKDEVDQLRMTLSKKNIQLNNYQFQSANSDEYSMNPYYSSRSPNRNQSTDYKSDIQTRYREKKALQESEAKSQELTRENTLQKAKIQLLESKYKTASQNITNLQESINSLEEKIRGIETQRKKLEKTQENYKNTSNSLSKQLEFINTKYLKKEKELDNVQQQLAVCQKSVDILTNKLQQSSNKGLEQLKNSESQCSSLKDKLLQREQQISHLKIEIQSSRMEINSLNESLKIQKKQYQSKLHSLETARSKHKKQYDQLYQKYASVLAQKAEAEQKIKDIEMQRKIIQDSLKKQVIEYEEKLQSKQYEFQQLKFTTESKIIQLERQLQQLR